MSVKDFCKFVRLFSAPSLLQPQATVAKRFKLLETNSLYIIVPIHRLPTGNLSPGYPFHHYCSCCLSVMLSYSWHISSGQQLWFWISKAPRTIPRMFTTPAQNLCLRNTWDLVLHTSHSLLIALSVSIPLLCPDFSLFTPASEAFKKCALWDSKSLSECSLWRTAQTVEQKPCKTHASPQNRQSE